MLKEIKQLLKERAPLSLKELAIHFAVQPETIRPMLQLLEEKRQIRSIEIRCSGGCAGCTALCREERLFYEPAPAEKCFLNPTPSAAP